MNFCLRLALVCFVSAGVGCASAPVRYYTLTPTADKNPPVSEATFAINVRVVHIPPQLNRAELIVRTGLTEVTLLENERWASPVIDEVQGAVRLELQRRLSGMSGMAAFTKLTLDIDLQHFEAQLGQYALLEASWSATLTAGGTPSNGTRTANCTFRADEEIHTGYAEMVEGYQREIAELADSIAAVLTSPASSDDPSCEKSSDQ